MRQTKNKKPKPGTLFCATVNSPLGGPPFFVIHSKGKDICRVDLYGNIVEWGSVDDWHDEIRRGWIKILYEPSGE